MRRRGVSRGRSGRLAWRPARAKVRRQMFRRAVFMIDLTRGERELDIAGRVQAFIRDVVIPYEGDPRIGATGRRTNCVSSWSARPRPRVCSRRTSASPTAGWACITARSPPCSAPRAIRCSGPIALNIMAPDEGNMYLLDKVGNAGAEGTLPAAAGRRRDPLGLLHDRAGRRGRLRPLDDEDHRAPGRQSLGDQRPQVASSPAPTGAACRHHHGQDRARRDHVPGRHARTRRSSSSGCWTPSTAPCRAATR